MVDENKINQHDDISYDSEWSYIGNEDAVEHSRKSWIPYSIVWRYNAYVKHSTHRLIYKLSRGRYPKGWITVYDEFSFMSPTAVKVSYSLFNTPEAQ